MVTRMEISPQKGIAVRKRTRLNLFHLHTTAAYRLAWALYKFEIQPFQRKKAPLKICLRVFDICISGKKRGGSKLLGN